MTTYYISGPIAGHEDLNIDAFRGASRRLAERRIRAILPHDLPPYTHVGPCPEVYGAAGEDGLHDGGCHVRGDLVVMLQYADGLYLLPGWSRSKGAQIEVLTARLLAMPIEYHPDAERGGSAVDLLAATYAEIDAQNAKWGEQNHIDGTGYPAAARQAEVARKRCQDAFAEGCGTWALILTEEVREAYAESEPEALRAELIQIAAVAVQWAAAIERRAEL